MLTIRNAVILLAITIALAFAPAGQSARAQTVMKMASATINDVQHEWQKTFAAELEKRIGDKIKVEIYPASQLGAIPRMAEGVLLGTIESFISPTAFLVGAEPKLKIFDAPGLFDSPKHLARVIHEPVYRDHLEQIALGKGLRIIGAIYNSPFIVLTKQPAPTLDDLKGLKIRTFASPLQIEPMQAIGASALPLPLSEVVPALQSGGIDGMLAGMPILVAFKYYDIAKTVTDLQFSIIVSVNVVNEAWFQSQSEEVRTAILDSGRTAEKAVLQWGINNVARTNRIWVEMGGKILALSDQDRASMNQTFKSVSDRILNADAKVAAEYQKLRAAAEAAR